MKQRVPLRKKKEYYEDIYSVDELNYYKLLSEEHKEEMFHNIWIYKEALGKALGKGLQYDLKQWNFSPYMADDNYIIELNGYKLKMTKFKKESVIGAIVIIL